MNKMAQGSNQELRSLEDHLYRTVWGKYYARPSQVRAAARKLRDRLNADGRRIAKAARG